MLFLRELAGASACRTRLSMPTRITNRNAARPDPLPPLPCQLPYDTSTGEWTRETSSAARNCILRNLERDFSWWRERPTCTTRLPDVDATLCRLRSQGPRAVLTNMMLLRSVNGRLSAKILLDPGDERGPMRHWPGRPVAALQQLAAVQQRIDDGLLPPLPNFTAILNPHDQPQQYARMDWCGMVPILSNSRVSMEHRDLMMPDFSFAPFSYLTNMIDANASSALAVPRGWPQEREAIYRAGRREPYSGKQRSLFWRGGQTHEQRRVYSNAIVERTVRLPAGVAADVKLCGSHCSLEDGLPPEAWCGHKQLLSLPGHSFAVGFKYTLLCSSLVVRGAHAGVCPASQCPRVFEQFWHAGLKDEEHFVSSRDVKDLSNAVQRADVHPQAALIATRSADYAYSVLDPDFISEYWHALLSGYAKSFDWSDPRQSSSAQMCAQPHRKHPTNNAERVCFRGGHGGCQLKLLGAASDDGFVPIPSMREMTEHCNSTTNMRDLYRSFARVLPLRFTGIHNGTVSETARSALQAWMQGPSRPVWSERRPPDGQTPLKRDGTPRKKGIKS